MSYNHIIDSFEYDGKIVRHTARSPVQIWLKPHDEIDKDNHLLVFWFGVTATPDNDFTSMILNEGFPYRMEGPGMSFPDHIVASVASCTHSLETYKELWDWLKREDSQTRLKEEIDSAKARDSERQDGSHEVSAAGGSLTEVTDRSSETQELPDYQSSQSASGTSGATAGSVQ